MRKLNQSIADTDWRNWIEHKQKLKFLHLWAENTDAEMFGTYVLELMFFE